METSYFVLLLFLGILIFVGFAYLSRQRYSGLERERAARWRDLAGSEERYRQMFVRTQAIKLILDAESLDLVEANPAACGFYRRSAEELRGCNLAELRAEPSRAAPRPGYSIERHRLADGELRDVEMYCSTTELRDRIYLYAIVHDITERRHAERAITAEKERLAVTLGSIADGVITTDLVGRVLMLNPAAEAITGWSPLEAQGRRVPEVLRLEGEQAERLDDPVTLATDGGSSFHDTLVMHLPGGIERQLEITGAPLREEADRIAGVVLAFRDVTQKMTQEDERIRSQKLEALAILAGGIAHDFNNLLTVVLGNLSMIQADEPGEDREPLEHAESAVLKARGLTGQLLTFSRGGTPVREAASLAELISDSVAFALRGSNVSSRVDLEEELAVVEIDTSQIHQVLNNLLINAVQAMPRGGTVRIEARNVEVAPSPLRRGRYVQVTVADTGVGIPREHLPRVFDPYFSTKPRGSGLGLATASSIVRRHEGVLSVDSVLGKGTTFTIYLPAGAHHATAAGTRRVEDVRGTGSILLMDDDSLVLEVTSRMLEALGYRVVAVADGEAAIERYREARGSGRPFDAVILDLTVPGGMGAQKTLERLREQDPEVRAVVASGYSNDPLLTDHRQYGFSGAVIKPFRSEELGGVLRRVLSGQRPHRETSSAPK